MPSMMLHPLLAPATQKPTLVNRRYSSNPMHKQHRLERSRVVQWCFAALDTVERPSSEIQLIDKFGSAEDAEKRRPEMVKAASRWFDGLERRLEGRDWIACADFTIVDLLVPDRRLTAYYARALARPAWPHTLSLYAKRLGVEVADIQ
jgi:glutathione S-transferase